MKPSQDLGKFVVSKEFIEIIKGLLETFNGDPEKVRLWLTTGNMNLGGFVPLKLYMMGRGHKVIDLIKNKTER